MTRRLRFAAALLALAFTTGAHAQSVRPAPSQGDPRIRVVRYDPNRIISLRGHLGYQMLIEFDAGERIENVAIGDSVGWQVTPNRAATLLFLKPLAAGAATNMTVITNQRRYAFELSSREASGPDDRSVIYAVRFAFPPPPPPPPEPPPPPPAPAPTLNFGYTIRGSDRIAPTRVFDDGAATYFAFGENTDTPAIFVVGLDGEEELVNVQTRGDYIVIDQLADAFVVRSGRHRAQVRRNGGREP
ncbi:MAG: TrbG/VirB9 family P-type conjugative transfer protein [Hyphomonadaceae bacterium]|nr:TrbG/VirB9 family P-type conjugative transfer protein [Hyphomonadaceae bacterium]